MDTILVRGNGPLNGEIAIAGAKNACLTLMPATLLTDEPLTLTNAPRLSDIRTMTALLQSLGAEVASLQDGQVLALSSDDIGNHTADYDIVRKMRASILVLGPLLALATFAVLGPLDEPTDSTTLRLVLLADFIYLLLLTGLVVARLARMAVARRNAAAGSLRQKDASVTASRPLR